MAASKERIAAKDIVRRDDNLGVMRVIVPKGQPVPEGFDATDEELGVKKAKAMPENKKAESKTAEK